MAQPATGSRTRVMALVDHVDVIGGAELLAVRIAAGLDADRFESWLCTTRSPAKGADPGVDAALEMLEQAGVRVLSLGRRTKTDIWRFGRLLSVLRRERIDVLHAHMFGSNAWGALLGRIARVPVVIAHEHTRNDPYAANRLRRFLDRELIARLSDAFVAVSRADQRYMTEIERIDPADTVYVPNGAPDVEVGSRAVARARLGLAVDAPVVASVGFMHRRKRFDLLVAAASELRERFGDLRVLVIGDGDECERLRQQIVELGLDETVTLLGRRADVAELLPALDVAVCCSDHEGTPISVLEYMAAGLPVVATDVGGNPDVIEDGVHGRIVAPGDASALAAAIAGLLGDRELARRLGEAGRRRREREFTLDAMCRRLERLYLELLTRKGRAAPVAS